MGYTYNTLLGELRRDFASGAERDWPAEAERLRRTLAANPATAKQGHVLGRVLTAHPDKSARILDYGCGTGTTALSLRLLGYAQVDGVDVKDQTANERFAQALGLNNGTLCMYDTKTLPFADQSYDVVVSQQVLEHVHNLDDYYREAARVLKPGGVALLDFPHRFVPFDSHARRWFIHWFPKPVRNLLYDRFTEKGAAHYANLLNLRSLGTHRRIARRHFSSFELVTAERLRAFTYQDDYEGNLSLRRLADRFFRLPLAGGGALALLSRLAIADVVCVK